MLYWRPSGSVSANPTLAESPVLRKPLTMASLMASSKNRCAARRMGRAPNWAALELPSCMTFSTRLGSMVRAISCSFSARCTVCCKISDAMLSRSSLPNGEKTTISSMRFSSSGLISCSSSSFTTSDNMAYSASFSSIVISSVLEFGMTLERSKMRLLPTLDVMTRMVFLKLTVRPLPSVSMPSSMIWSRMLRTSLCAFSNSSSKTRECGARRTASVS
mmetsp:Transcript_5759/g.15598  ORF Transcript_5759/g.15598 Transcript_5759/m.15598 type:complete len:218 (+) Transcript_5759:167-820(+)